MYKFFRGKKQITIKADFRLLFLSPQHFFPCKLFLITIKKVFRECKVKKKTRKVWYIVEEEENWATLWMQENLFPIFCQQLKAIWVRFKRKILIRSREKENLAVFLVIRKDENEILLSQPLGSFKKTFCFNLKSKFS